MLKVTLLFQVIPTMVGFYLLWPHFYLWQVSGALSKVDDDIQEQLEQRQGYFLENVQELGKKEIRNDVTSICTALGCRESELTFTGMESDNDVDYNIRWQMTMHMDLYDLPVLLEGIRRIARTQTLLSLEVQQYSSHAKIILQYAYRNPNVQGLAWLKELSLPSEHKSMLFEASKIHLWKRFVEAEVRRRNAADITIRLIQPDLAKHLILLKKQQGVLMYRPTNGFTFMPLKTE